MTRGFARPRIASSLPEAGITAGVLAGTVEIAQSMRQRGFRMIALGTDINLYSRALSDELALVRSNGAGAT
jgi:2-keto-3-deoxy-L-rhamnonate aldolase RhmA